MHIRCMVLPARCRPHAKDPVRVTDQLPTRRHQANDVSCHSKHTPAITGAGGKSDSEVASTLTCIANVKDVAPKCGSTVCPTLCARHLRYAHHMHSHMPIAQGAC